MGICRAMSALALISASLFSCKVSDSKSSTKEFEFSADICRELQQAVDKRWNASLGTSKAVYHSKLASQEASIIEYELPRYQGRLDEIRSGEGPANGPTGKVGALPPKPSSGSDKAKQLSPTTKDSGSVAQKPNSSPASSALRLASDPLPSRGSGASGVCPGCDQSTIERKLAALKKNKAAIGSCIYRDSAVPSNSSSSSDPSQGLTEKEKAERAVAVEKMKAMIYAATQPKELCNWFAQHSSGVGANRDRCQRDIVASFCKGLVDIGGDAAVDYINGTGSAAGTATDLVKPIPGIVKDAIIGCSQQWAYDKFKEALRDGTFGSLSKAVKDQAKAAIKSDKLGPVSEQEKIAELKKNIALAICKAGAGLVASQIDETPQVNYDHPCAAIFQGSKSRAKACLNTTASGCKIAAGDVDIKNFFPKGITDDRPLATLSAEAANTIAKMGCKSTGKVGSAACATISEAAAQIRSAITTGNNDWAHCLGTDQAGACAGTKMAELWLGIRVEDLKTPFRQPYELKIPGKSAIMIEDACVCDHACYEDDWATDSLLKQGVYAQRAIGAGSAGVRECANMEGAWNWINPNAGYMKSKNGYYLYWKTTNCRIKQLKDSSPLDSSDPGGVKFSASPLDGNSFREKTVFSMARDGICL